MPPRPKTNIETSVDVRPEVSPKAWALQGTGEFAGFVDDAFGSAKTKSSSSLYMKQQRFVRDYLQLASPYRGLLLYHGLGSGKTCSAIAVTEAMRAERPDVKVFVMTPASLRRNYVRELRMCGGQAYRESQRWTLRQAEQSSRPLPDAKLIRAHKGVWMPGEPEGRTFESLSDTEREQVREQVDSVISKTHVFVGYNGLSAAAVRRLLGEGADATNPFEDSVVVIDEVHNFVSNVSNGLLLTRVYDAIMSAARCKVVLLSGTPLVNKPEELAYAVNLAHGPITVHVYTLRRALLPAERQALESSSVVNDFEEGTTGLRGSLLPTVLIRLLPEGFRRVDPGSPFVARDPGLDLPGMEAEVSALLRGCGIVSGTTRRVLLLPNDADEFRRVFVDTSSFEVRNTEVLQRRMQGTVSFFRGHAEELYPRLGKMTLVRTPMSPRQFSEYSVQRAIEVAKERRAKRARAAISRGGQSDFDVDDANYRPFSRAVCNFAFPEDVPRPYKSSIAVVDDDENSSSIERNRERAYLKALDDAVASLRSMPGRLVVAEKPGMDAGLDALSPKMAAIVRAVARENAGTSIVYSQFRRAEGVKLLSAALEANGFAEVTLFRQDQAVRAKVQGPRQSARYMVYSNDDPMIASVMLLIFNNQLSELPPLILQDLKDMYGKRDLTNLRGELVRTLLFTKSGSEGISTRNVRQVHILEPFWHANRVEQVIGRARRAHSHDELPPGERSVDVFVYISTFTPEQAKNLKLQKDPDGGKTSDEFVHDVAQRKRKVLRGMLSAVRRAAVDCKLHAASDAEASKCFAPDSGARNRGRVYHALRLDEDLPAASSSRDGSDGLVAVRVDGTKYYADLNTGELYDYESMRLTKKVVPVGKRLNAEDLADAKKKRRS